MKKFFTLLFAAASGMCAMAQGITSLDEVEADAKYTISCERGYVTIDEGYTKLVGNNAAGVNKTFDATNPDFQFQFVEADGAYYLYNVGAEAYTDANGNLVELDGAVPVNLRAWGDGTVQPYWGEETDNKNLNIGGSKNVEINGWNSKDAGDSFKIVKLELINYTVEVVGCEDGGVIIGEDTYANGDKVETFAAVAAGATATEQENYLATVTIEGNVIRVEYAYARLVTSLDELTNEKAYTLICDRAQLTTAEGEEGLVVAATKSKDVKSAAARFALINYNDNLYLWSIAGEGFVLDDKTIAKSAEAPVLVLEDKGDNKFFAMYGEHYLNIDGNANVFIDDWSTPDAGNQYKIYEVADFEDAGTPIAVLLTTSIESISTSSSAAIYDLQGRRVVAPAEGLYISNRKVIRK